MKKLLLFLLALPALAFGQPTPVGGPAPATQAEVNAGTVQNKYVSPFTLKNWTGGGGGSSAFNALTSGTNTTAAMVVGSGASLAATGTGTIAATSLTSLAADPADAGVVRLGNGEFVEWEANPTGTDNTLTVNTSNIFAFSAGLTTPGQYTSSVATGTAPLVITSTTLVPNLHVATSDAVPITGVTGLGANVLTPLQTGVGSAGAFITFNGDAGTPNTITLTNAGGTATALTAGNATNVGTTITSTNASYYIPFVSSSSSGNQALGINSGFSINPSTLAITTSGSITAGNGSANAGGVVLTQGTANSPGTTAITLQSPTAVTSYTITLPTTVQSTGVMSWTVSSTNATLASVTTLPSSLTIPSPVFSSGATASGSGNFDLSGSSGTFLTGTGAVTHNGAVTLGNTLSMGGTALSFGALPSGATTAGTLKTDAGNTYTVTGTNTATAFQAVYHGAPTFTDASAGTVTDLFSENWVAPVVAGSLANTRKHTLGVLDSTSAASSITGGFVVAAAYATTATAVGIGGGNINAGGTITSGGQITAGSLSVNGSSSLQQTTTSGTSGTSSLTIQGVAHSGNVLPLVQFNSQADTTITASTESPVFNTSTASRQWSTGTLALQRDFLFKGNTIAFVGASTVTDLATVGIIPGAAGTNATITRNHSLAIQDSTSSTTPITGAFVIANAIGTAANSIGFGAGNMSMGGKTLTYNNVATAGNGIPSIYGAGRVTAQAAANASIATYTVGAADGTFIVSANVLVTTATTHNFTVTCAYTDEGNTARTITFTFSNLGGTLATSIINTGGTVPYEGVPLHIRCKASTTITIATAAGGVYTSVVYNAEGLIVQEA